MTAAVTGNSNQRFAVDAPAILIGDEGAETRCRLLDVSRSGFRAKLPGIGMAVGFTKLISGRDTFPIEIRWTTGHELGGVFL